MAIELRKMGSRTTVATEADRKSLNDSKLEVVNGLFKAIHAQGGSAAPPPNQSKSPFALSESKSKEAANVPDFQITLNLAYGLYKGCHQGGKQHGFGIMTFNESDPLKRKVFRGNYKDGKVHGTGQLTWANGITYEGDFKQDEIAGTGTMIWPDGKRYEGGFINGKKSGKGKLRFISGEEYMGDFANDSYHGKGILIFSNGDRYEGDFFNGQMTGQGKKIYKDGTIYEGTWAEGKWLSGTESFSEEMSGEEKDMFCSEESLKKGPEASF